MVAGWFLLWVCSVSRIFHIMLASPGSPISSLLSPHQTWCLLWKHQGSWFPSLVGTTTSSTHHLLCHNFFLLPGLIPHGFQDLRFTTQFWWQLTEACRSLFPGWPLSAHNDHPSSSLAMFNIWFKCHIFFQVSPISLGQSFPSFVLPQPYVHTLLEDFTTVIFVVAEREWAHGRIAGRAEGEREF